MKQWEREDGGSLGIPDSPSERKLEVEVGVPFGGGRCVGERGGARHDVISGIAALGCLAASPVRSFGRASASSLLHPIASIQSDTCPSNVLRQNGVEVAYAVVYVHVLNHGKQVL
jgi:hypothetical protein